MREQLKSAIISNIGRVLVGLIIMLLTYAIAPVKQLIDVPKTMKSMQLEIENSQKEFVTILNKHQETDSCLLLQVENLHLAYKYVNTEVGTIKSKIDAVQDEFPILHTRFNDIEQAVEYTRQNELALELPFLNTYHE